MWFFYQNPLEANGKTELYQGQVGRSAWFEVACCPPNITRFLPSVPGYVYALNNNIIYVNLFMANSMAIEVGGVQVALKQETRYPWDGAVKIAVDPEKPGEFALYIRIPGWARNEPVPSDLYRFADQNAEMPELKVNGAAVALDMERGYARIRRTWKKGDAVELNLPMPVRRVLANDAVKADAGRVALQRGPIVYCAEGVDNGGKVLDLALPDAGVFQAEYRPELLNGVVILKGKAVVEKKSAGGKIVPQQDRDVLFIPYYAWANRGVGEMTVWLPRK
jgi:uncharacterized protein